MQSTATAPFQYYPALLSALQLLRFNNIFY